MMYWPIGAMFGYCVAASCAIAWCAVQSTTSSAKPSIAIVRTVFFSMVVLLRMRRLSVRPDPNDGAHLDRRPTRDDGFASPRQRLVHVSRFQYPKTAYVLLGLNVRPVGDDHLATGLLT